MKNKKFKNYRIIILIFVTLLLGFQCDNSNLNRIQKKRKIRFITENNANCYYIYKNQPMGMEYELAKGFAEYLNVELEIITPDWQQMYNFLRKNKADIIAANLTITDQRKNILEFSDELISIQQFIITRNDNRKLKSEKDLAGYTIHLRKNTSYHERLIALQENGIDFKMELYDDIPSEEFIRRVSTGEIEVTVSDSHIARLNRRYYPNIRMAFPIEEEQSLGWAVKKGNTALVNKINDYFAIIQENGTYDKLFNKYYGSSEIFDYCCNYIPGITFQSSCKKLHRSSWSDATYSCYCKGNGN